MNEATTTFGHPDSNRIIKVNHAGEFGAVNSGHLYRQVEFLEGVDVEAHTAVASIIADEEAHRRRRS